MNPTNKELQSAIGTSFRLSNNKPKSELANIKELEEADKEMLRAMADTYPRPHLGYRQEPSLENRIGGALGILMNPKTHGDSAKRLLCWPVSDIDRGHANQLAMEWIRDILLTLLARAPSEDLIHIHKTLLERLSSSLPPEPEHGNYHTALIHTLSQRATAPQSQHSQRDHLRSTEPESHNAQHSPQHSPKHGLNPKPSKNSE